MIKIVIVTAILKIENTLVLTITQVIITIKRIIVPNVDLARKAGQNAALRAKNPSVIVALRAVNVTLRVDQRVPVNTALRAKYPMMVALRAGMNIAP